jgi:hypothetical protein
MRLAAGHFEGERVAFSIRAEMDFDGEAAAPAAERLLFLTRLKAASFRKGSLGIIYL